MEGGGAAVLRLGKRYASELGPGLMGSVFLHALIALLLLLLMLRSVSQNPKTDVRTVPVDVVMLGKETMAPPAPQKALVPQQKASQAAKEQPATANSASGVAPRKTREPVDDLENRLRALAKLRQPDSTLPILENSGASDVAATSDNAIPGDQATYALRDFVRAQVLRRWNLDLARLGARRFDILLHVVMTREGKITKAEIVDKQRYANDVVYHQVALSARNAILLASPIALPPGRYEASMDMTLKLNPRDALQ
jgi:hypothetical protein